MTQTAEPRSNLITDPPGSKLVLLHEVARQKAGSKVRFLGCVAQYSIQTGHLTLAHPTHPHWPSDEALATDRVRVDVTLLLETIKPELLDTGVWVNVIGYVRKREGEQSVEGQGREKTVQATLVWSAEGLRVEEYENTVQRMKEDGRNEKERERTQQRELTSKNLRS